MAAKIPPGLDPKLAKIALAGGKNWGPTDQARYDKLVKERDSGNTQATSSNNRPTYNQGNRNTGMFNFASIMDKFYKWEPDSTDDPAGAAIKNTFMSNAIQSALNTQQAQELAASNALLATNQMTVAAGLEFGNKSAIMEKEFNYGMQKMGAEYDFQEQFANNDANRRNNELALRGDIQQNQTRLESSENRLNIAAQGRENVNLQNVKGDQAIDQIKQAGKNEKGLQKLKTAGAVEQIEKKGDIEKDMLATKGEQALQQISGQGDQDVRKIDAQAFADRKLQKVKGKQALQQISGQGDQDVRKIEATGRQERKSMMQQTKEDDKTAARQSKYARGLAGMF